LAIVGIAASATSVGTLERLFAHLPRDSGLAYIVVLKSDGGVKPERLLEALDRQSGLPGVIAADGARLLPNHVYLPPLDKQLTLDDGRIVLDVPTAARGSRGSIDTFLVSLAQNGERAVGVVLSGLASDGVLGARTLKETGGLIVAEADAGADGATHDEALTHTALGIADLVLPAEKISEQIASYARHLAAASSAASFEALKADGAQHLPRIAALLRNRTSHDFHGYKPNTFLRRVQRRMHVARVDKVDAYLEVLRNTPEEIDHLFQDLLIGVTRFFRDPLEFGVVEQQVIPQLFDGKTAADHVRVWVMGCSTGEEAYSLGILLREHMATLDVVPHVQIFATDIDGRALSLARAGRFSEALVKDIPPERLARWFVREGDTYVVHTDLREMCLFSAHNITKDAPFSRIDLISCRNLLIYLNTDLQARVIPLFHFSLRPGGHLFLGPSENVTRHPKLFAPIDRKHRIFKRLETITRVMPEFPLTARSGAPQPIGSAPRLRQINGHLSKHAERIAERYAPAYVIVDGDYEVLHFSGRTGRYLDPSSGVANLNLLSLIHRDLRIDLRGALHKAADQAAPVKVDSLRMEIDGNAQLVTVVVEPARSNDDDVPTYVVLFQDGGPAIDLVLPPPETGAQRDEHVQRLEADLRLTRERLQATIEELESTNEELKSSNEEYQSINEELQSANEELETSKEELQSVNEELQTVNGELAHRVNELAKSNSDLKNLLESTQIATIFLDNDVRVRSFTPAAAELFYLLDTDVGRPMGHIGARVNYPELQDDVQKVLRTLTPVERNISDPDANTHYFVRVLPYRSIDNFIAGVVLTFLDVTAAARAERALSHSQALYKLILDSSTDYAIIATDKNGLVTAWNSGAEHIFGWTAAEMLGRTADIIFTAEDRSDGAPKRERATADTEDRAADERWHVRKDGSRFWASGMMTPMRDGELSGYLKILHDQTGERSAAERQKLLLAELQHRVRNILAVVRSLASRTVETSGSLEEFSQNFEGRLSTLARTQNVLTRTSTATVDLGELVRDELLSVGARDGEQVEVGGPPVRLRQAAAETIALAVHELTTNALKYGALAQADGRLVVNWRVFNTKAGPKLSLDWRESGVRALVTNPGRSGFGRELIERGLPYELGAATSLDFSPGGLRAAIELPLDDKIIVVEDEPEGAE